MGDGLPPNIVHERRRNDDLVITLVRQMTESHDHLTEKVGGLSDKMIRFEGVLDTQVKTIEKYNNYGSRILQLEQLPAIIQDIKKTCAAVQAAKAEASKRFQVPWGAVVSGIIVGVIVGVFMLVINYLKDHT